MSERDDTWDFECMASSLDSREAAQVPRSDDAPYLELITTSRALPTSTRAPKPKSAEEVSYLRLVPSMPESVRKEPEKHHRDRAVQLALFPDLEATPSLLAVLDMSCVSDKAFIALVREVRPRWMLDLRPAPRFDYGRLNRRLAFRLFSEHSVNYLDIAASLNIRDRHDARLHAGILSRELNELLARYSEPLIGPIVVLLDVPSVALTAKEVLTGTLEPRPRSGWKPRVVVVHGEQYRLV